MALFTTVFAVVFGGAGLPFAAAFGIPWILDSLIPRMRWKHPKTPGAMLAFGMLHPATRDDWKRADGGFDSIFANESLGLRVKRTWPGDSVDVGFPISASERRLLLYAIEDFRKREIARRKAEALENVVRQFERAYGNNARSSNVVPLRERKGA